MHVGHFHSSSFNEFLAEQSIPIRKGLRRPKSHYDLRPTSEIYCRQIIGDLTEQVDELKKQIVKRQKEGMLLAIKSRIL